MMGTDMNKEKKPKSRISEMIDILKKNDIAHGLTPEKLKVILEELGPTFVKLGQILSMRSDLIPSEYCDTLVHLRAEVTPIPFFEIKRIIQEEFGVKSWKEIFRFFDSSPIGSASIAQVHKAVLKDGKPVVVKVQRPGIKETMQRDMSILRKAVGFIKFAPDLGDPMDFRIMIEEMWTVAQQEMDFLIEAAHLGEFKRLNQNILYIGCPSVEKRYTTSHILVMEYIDGMPIDKKEELINHGYDLVEISEKLAENYLKQVLEDGFFHADPHPGNLMIQEGKIIWLDLGMVGRLSMRDKEYFSDAVEAIISSDVYALKNIILSMGVLHQKIDHAALYSDIDLLLTRYGKLDFDSFHIGQFLMDTNDLTNRHHIGMPEGVSMLGRGLMTIEGVLADLNPNINIMQAITAHMAGKELDLKKELKETGAAALITLRKSMDIPAHLSDILKMTVKGQTKVNLEITGSEEPLFKIDEMVNKLMLSIICAGLLVGSSLICTTDMAGKLFGIPVLGAIGFLLALLLGMVLIYSILKKK